jgi:hypothetical protein
MTALPLKIAVAVIVAVVCFTIFAGLFNAGQRVEDETAELGKEMLNSSQYVAEQVLSLALEEDE